MKRARAQGFSFVEILIVISILVILVAIFLPVGRGARSDAVSSRDLQSLRQLALAHGLYEEQFGEVPHDFDALLAVNPDLSRIAASERDPTRAGVANLIRREIGIDLPTDLRRSFAMPSDLKMKPWLLREEFADCQNPGFFIDATGFAPKDEARFPTEIRGAYRRALREGSVVQRTVIVTKPTPNSTFVAFTSLFCDSTPDQREAWRPH